MCAFFFKYSSLKAYRRRALSVNDMYESRNDVSSTHVFRRERAVRAHKPAKDSSLGVTSRFLPSFSPHPLIFFVFSPPLSFKIAIYRSTRHLSPFRGLPRTRAFRLHLGIGPRNSRCTPSCPMEKKQRRRRNRVEKRIL